MIFKISNFIAFSVKEKAECVTTYNETKSVAQSQQNYRPKHQKIHIFSILSKAGFKTFKTVIP